MNRGNGGRGLGNLKVSRKVDKLARNSMQLILLYPSDEEKTYKKLFTDSVRTAH